VSPFAATSRSTDDHRNSGLSARRTEGGGYRDETYTATGVYGSLPSAIDITVTLTAGMFTRAAVTGGVDPARAYIEDLLPDILEGRLQPGRVFDRTVTIDAVPDAYRAMDAREALKVLITL